MTARILLAGLFAAALLPRPALSADAIPAYDPVLSCTEAARRAGDREAPPRPECLEAETQAKAIAASLWSAKPAGLRQRCARLSERRKSFVTLNACLRSDASGTR
ncbi:hypothetical protein EJV46_05705 [Roseococcus sp. SYP-B2431]|uniref:hypothetical protein n=1 Tax=Roseococcus sp. SYP-B2431 TaxID=2496640 RepID=UPI00103993FE|nr:hypothetical protein [Roseococcus sp. SYP-B2431]TCI00147.1 hypothetical protein EJV46_05705 [Roseococcus sp. SYP-B2431]